MRQQASKGHCGNPHYRKGYYGKGYYRNGYCAILLPRAARRYATRFADERLGAPGTGQSPTQGGATLISKKLDGLTQDRKARMNLNVPTARFTEDEVMVITIEGELDLSTIDRAEVPAQEAIAMRRPVVFDLSGCTFIDSSALRLLLQVHRALTAVDLDVPMAIAIGDSPVGKMLSLTAIDQSIPVLPTLEAAQSLQA
jgi:anti-anti-sigma factor